MSNQPRPTTKVKATTKTLQTSPSKLRSGMQSQNKFQLLSRNTAQHGLDEMRAASHDGAAPSDRPTDRSTVSRNERHRKRLTKLGSPMQLRESVLKVKRFL